MSAPTAAPSKALTPYQQVEARLTNPQQVEAFKKMLPPHITPERFQRAALVTLQRTPSLADCERESLYLSIAAAAQDGLMPDGKEAVIVPMKGKAVYWRMYAGLLKKARNSGEIKSFMADTIHKNDPFTYKVDELGQHLNHNPDMLSERGPVIGAYAMAWTKDGGYYVMVMSKAQIDKRRNVSRASGSGPWVDWYEEQCKKTVGKALCAIMPSSTDILGMPTPDIEDEGGDRLPVESFVPKGQPEAAPAPAAAPKGAGGKTKDAVLGQGQGAPAAAVSSIEEAHVVSETPKPQAQGDGSLPI